MNFEIKFTPEAEETFDALVNQLRQRWSDQFVVKFENSVLNSLKTISVTPYMYPIVEEVTGIRKCILHKNCSMLYKVYDEVVLIIYFWDNRQDPIITF